MLKIKFERIDWQVKIILKDVNISINWNLTFRTKFKDNLYSSKFNLSNNDIIEIINEIIDAELIATSLKEEDWFEERYDWIKSYIYFINK